ncbi:MAG: DM13 domain-containing protein [Acidimicrobiales bacterium]
MEFLRNNKLPAAIGGFVVAGFVAWLAFGFFGIQAIFIDESVDQADPFAVAAAADGSTDADADRDDAADDTGAAPAATDDGPSAEGDEPADTDRNGPATGATSPFVESSGSFIGLEHPAVGQATILSDGERRFLRFENFETDNGPDLFVYLVAEAGAEGDRGLFDDDFVNLGPLAGNIGDQNYEVDIDLDLDRYNTVVIWCDRFNAAFGAADLI